MGDVVLERLQAMASAFDNAYAAASALTSGDVPSAVRTAAKEAASAAKQAAQDARGLCDAVCSTDWMDAQKSQWTSAQVDALPDGAFLYVAPGGSKDAEGKTTPRSLRHFPVRGPDGKPDPAHVRNALARIPQSGVPDAAKTSATAAARKLLADVKG